MATTNDLKNGMVLNLDGQLWQVIWFQHHKPGKGGAVVRSKLKSIESGKTVDKTFNADVKVEVANVEDRKSTRLNSSHANISYAVFCLKKKKINVFIVYLH